MKVLAVTLLALVAAVAARNIDIENVIELEDISAYGYLAKVGAPLADKIRQAEAEQQQSGRIVGGSSASQGQFPYQAGIIIDFTNFQAVCGGSILNNRRVLTAAHCWFDGQNQGWRFTLVFGSLTIFSGGTRIATSDVVMHNSWNPSLARNDIAIVRLPSTLGFNNNIAPIALPSGSELNENFAGTTVTASGFGATQNGGSVSPTLNHVNLPVISNTECWSSFPVIIQASHICTSGAGGRGTCGGDSGGPIVAWRNNRNIVVGVASFVHVSGCSSGRPAAFARVTSFVTWINSLL